MLRWMHLSLAYVFFALALIGSVLPIMPSVPFAIVAAFFAAKGSPRMHRWLLSRPVLGPALAAWEREGAISRSSKAVAIISMVLSFALIVWRLPQRPGLWLLVALVFVSVSVFMLSRPEPSLSSALVAANEGAQSGPGPTP